MRQRQIISLIAVILILSTSVSAWAETREECMRKVGKHTNLAIGAGAVGTAGGAAGAVACSGFLAAVIFDLGISYAACVAAAITVGTIVGTAAAEVHNNSKESECDKLPRLK